MLKKLSGGQTLLLLIPATLLTTRAGYSLPPAALPPGNIYKAAFHDTLITALPDSSAANTVLLRVGLNKNVKSFVNSYVVREDEFLRKMERRSETYFPTIEKIFDKYDLPLQLKYLAIVESKLQKTAHSPAGARGLWQLMPGTARGLGLKVSGKTDERVHLNRSTVAAAKYLRGLYRQFGDWLLVVAAYNCGPGGVYKAMKKAGSKNYWALQRYLPAESRGHVKRFIGIHYYFEGDGSLVTQTKAENKTWREKLLALQKAAEEEQADDSIAIFANAAMR
ncbi:MAG: lytic transglycosylase domain-containing protein [Flavisolibacter sp.]